MRCVFVITCLVLIVPGAIRVAHADEGWLDCSAIRKGDKAACEAKVKAQCHDDQDGHWGEKHRCETAIVKAADACHNGGWAAACEKLSGLTNKCNWAHFSGTKSNKERFTAEFV